MKQRAEGHEPGVKKHSKYYKLNPALLLIEEGFNVRIDTPEAREKIGKMKLDILAGASMPAIDVRNDVGGSFVVDGHRRTTAFQELIAEGHIILEVDVRELNGNATGRKLGTAVPLSPEAQALADRVFHMLGTAEGSEPISTLEQGIGYLKLVKIGISRAVIAAEEHKSQSHVDQALTLAMSSPDVHMLVALGKVPGRVAIKAIKEHGSDAGPFLQSLLDRSKKGKLTQKSISGTALPRKLADRCENTIRTIFTQSFEIAARVAIQDAKDEDFVNVQMPKAQLRALLDANEEIAKVRTKAGSSAAPA